MHTEKGDIPVRNISELVRFCKTLPSEEDVLDDILKSLKDMVNEEDE